MICAFWQEHVGSQEGSNDWLGVDELIRFLVKFGSWLAQHFIEKAIPWYSSMPTDLARNLALSMQTMSPPGSAQRRCSQYGR